MKVRGKLTSPTGAFDFSGYRVRVRFRQLAPLPGLEGDPEATLMGPAETSAATNASGDYEISLDDALKPGGPFEWAVLAPDGRVVESITFDQAPTADLDFRVRPLEPPQPATEPDSRPTAAQRLVGRLLDHLGKSSTTGDVTIVMFGKAVAADPFSPLAVFRTDPQGYFSGERPDGKFAEVVARVAIDGQLVELPIRLIDSQVPLRVLLVLPAPEQRPASDGAAAPHDAPCDCDKPKPPLGASPEDVVNAVGTYTSDLGGACVQFTTPNRSIDEFTYYALIRTTDPDIKGLTLGPDRKLMIDANQRWDLPATFRALDVLAEFGLEWLEEPLRADDLWAYRRLRKHSPVPIALGENLHTIYRFRDFIEAEAVDIIQPNIIRVGGITPFRRIVELARTHSIRVAPHLLPELSGQLALTLAEPVSVEDVEDASFGQLGILAGPSPVRISNTTGTIRLSSAGLPGLGFEFAGAWPPTQATDTSAPESKGNRIEYSNS